MVPLGGAIRGRFLTLRAGSGARWRTRAGTATLLQRVTPGGRRTLVIMTMALALTLGAGSARAQYLLRFNATTTGAVTFTGNSLGLSKAPGLNAPGTAHSIGTFITTDLTSQDGTAWPKGTTSDWRLNASSAQLNLPPGAGVLHAELVWSGTWAEGTGQENVRAFLDEAVTLVTPEGTLSVSPDAASSRTLGSVGATGKCSATCFYVRSADVTAAVQAAGPGAYTVGRVPATQADREDTSNAAGWTLAVVYQDFSLPVRNLTVFTGAEKSGAAPAQVSGFCTPPTGALTGRLAVSAIEGDASETGDEMRFGPTASPGTQDRLQGTRNRLTNFFASQITDDRGDLDVTGTFGTVNHDPGKNRAGARQGWDITNVDVSARLLPAQTTAFAQGTTKGEAYVITTLGLQIDVGAPRFRNPSLSVDRASAVPGDVLTYTLTLDNTQGTAAASNVMVFDTPPAGTAFVPNSVMINGTPQPGVSPETGVAVGTVGPGAVVTVTYRVQVVPTSPAVASYANDARWTFDYTSCAGQPTQHLEIVSNTVTATTPRIEGSKEMFPADVAPGEPITVTFRLTNTGTSPSSGTSVSDNPFPAGLIYVPGSNEVNAVLSPVPDNTPGFAGPLFSPGAPSGQIVPGASAIQIFQLEAVPTAAWPIQKVLSIDADGPRGRAQ